MATTPAAAALPECLACAVTRATWIIPRGRRPVRASNSTKKAGAISAPKWSREFDYPLVLADGRTLVTLRDAATYITKLPKAEQDLDIWQIAVEHLIRAAETGGAWLMLARIGVQGVAPRPGPRVQPQSQRNALGQAEAEAGSMSATNWSHIVVTDRG